MMVAIGQPWTDTPLFLRFNLVLFLLYASAFLGSTEGQNFIYFDF